MKIIVEHHFIMFIKKVENLTFINFSLILEFFGSYQLYPGVFAEISFVYPVVLSHCLSLVSWIRKQVSICFMNKFSKAFPIFLFDKIKI